MKRDQWKPSQYSFLCEKHFTPDDYVMGKEAANRLKKYLKPDAIPSVFDFPPHLFKQTSPRSPPKKRQATTTVTGVPCKKPKTGSQPVGHDQNYTVSPRKLIPKMKKALQEKRKKIKTLSKKSL